MDDYAEYSAVRAEIYKLLAAPFYTEAAPDYLARLKKYIPVFITMAEEFASAEIREGVSLLEVFFDKNTNPDKTAREYRRFFARLFLGISQHDAVKNICPQESYYLSPKHLIMQEQRDQVLEIYCGEGIGKTDNFKEPEDHLSAEFHFMAHLCKRSASGKDTLGVQQKFLVDHILKWVPICCKDLYLQSGKLPDESGLYYQGIAKLTEGFIICETLFVGDLAA
ncbi:MAG: molecular chaperone TorD family protein [Deferribacteraceae bacterium]|jgi:TorA maturation chaperone TorD|nr:molecular chaperone TorD family protein [Deferribacteraceae bacterium]